MKYLCVDHAIMAMQECTACEPHPSFFIQDHGIPSFFEWSVDWSIVVTFSLSMPILKECCIMVEGAILCQVSCSKMPMFFLWNPQSGVIQDGRILVDDTEAPAVGELLLTGLNEISLQVRVGREFISRGFSWAVQS